MAVFNLLSTLGVLLIATIISTFLFGILTLQVFIYFINFPTDKKALKIMVVIVWLCELVHSICISHSTFYYSILNYGNPESLVRSAVSLRGIIFLSGIISFIVQSFFADRVRIISKGSLIIPILGWILATIRLILGIFANVEGIITTNLVEFVEKWKPVLTTIFAVNLVNDTIICGSLCYYLHRRKPGSFKRTVRTIDKIIVWTMHTGLITGITSITTVILFLTMPNNFIWIGNYTILARLFSNSLLASLNARSTFRHNARVIDSTLVSRHATRAQNTDNQSNENMVIKLSTLTAEVSGDGNI